MTPSPVPVQVAPAEWWQILSALSPLAVLIAAIVAATVGLMTLRQRARADNRSEWWRRAEWALNASLSENKSEAEMGQKAIDLLGRSELATDEDLSLLKIGTEDALEDADRARQVESHTSITGSAQATPKKVDDGGDEGENRGDSSDHAGR